MEDYYKLLDIQESKNLAEIGKYLRELNKQYRRRVNADKPDVVQEATEKLEQINRALVKFGSEAERAAYDRELAGYRAEQELKQPLADVNLYQKFGLTMEAAEANIRQTLETAEARLPAGGSSEVEREKSLVALARRILLDADRRKEYDAQLRQKQAFEQEKAAKKSAPLHVNGTEVHDWLSLESILAAHPHEGLYLLQDGEIEAWLRWSLNHHQRANWVKEIAERSRTSHTPYMVFEELLRLVNGNRPFVMYSRGQGPAEGPVVTARQLREIPPLADKHWSLFITQFDYLLQWVAFQDEGTILAKYRRFPPHESGDVQLERLLYCLDERLAAPGLVVEGEASQNVVDFGTIRKWDAPSKQIKIKHAGRGYLYGSIKSSNSWLTADKAFFAGPETVVTLVLNKEQLPAGEKSQAVVTLYPVDGRLRPVEIQVIVTQQTTWGSVKSLFGK